MRYYDEFDRKKYAYDANTDEYKYVVNDDTVSFSHNGTEIEGAYEPEKDTAAYSKHFITEELEGKKPKDIKTTMEPKELYYIRTFFLCFNPQAQRIIIRIFLSHIAMSRSIPELHELLVERKPFCVDFIFGWRGG